MARHQVFVVAAPIMNSEKVLQTLRDRLRELGNDSFATLPMVHFASFVILDRQTTNLPPMLVMECNIDGSSDDFFGALLDTPAIDVDRIFECCTCYPSGNDRAAKLRYFKTRERRPQLYHVGAPWRSVGSIRDDRDLRRRVDDRLHTAVNGSLIADIGVPPAGQREYWAWEIFEPWAAWLLGLGGPALAWGLFIITRRSPLPSWVVMGLTAIYAAFVLKSVLGALDLWNHALPALRARVRPWIWWIPAAGVSAGIGWLLWARWPLAAIGLHAALLLTLIFNIYAAVRRRSNERLAAIRVNADGKPITEIWEAFRSLRVEYHSETDWAQRMWYWGWWLFTYLAFALGIWAAERRWGVWGVVALTGALFFAKAMWLAVLAGWPAKHASGSDTARIVLFIILAPLGAIAVSWLVMVLKWPPWLWAFLMPGVLAFLVLASLFSLWAMPLPSPKPENLRRRGENLEKVAGQEDYGVQNHMTAVVVLRDDYPFRVPALRAFLRVLNTLFYRCWAPDLYRGKLFGIPTVHFAQWVLLDSRNYLFLSNYDNSWTTYLDDFGEILAAGLQKVWGQGRGNPGIKDLGRFKDYARTTMVPHAHWYSAYPGITVRQVWNNREIRRGLAKVKGEEGMVRTLRRLALAPRVLPDFYHGRIR